MKVEPIPVHRVAILRTFAQYLEELGTPVERAFNKVGLPYYALENINNYVPSHRFWSFVINTAENESIKDLGFRVGNEFGVQIVDPKIESILNQSLTLYQGLQNASEFCNKTITHSQVGLFQPPASDYTYFYHQPSCDNSNPVVEHIGWFGLEWMNSLIKMYAGPQWKPEEMGIISENRPTQFILDHYPNTLIRPSQKFSYIVLNNKLLDLPPLKPLAVNKGAPQLLYTSYGANLSDSLEQVLLSYIKDENLDIYLAAQLANISVRSLQRRLKKEGHSFRQLREKVRFKVAREMLLNPEIKIYEIGFLLGYTDSSNFARSFHRIAGVSPGLYRKLHMQ